MNCIYLEDLIDSENTVLFYQNNNAAKIRPSYSQANMVVDAISWLDYASGVRVAYAFVIPALREAARHVIPSANDSV